MMQHLSRPTLCKPLCRLAEAAIATAAIALLANLSSPTNTAEVEPQPQLQLAIGENQPVAAR